MIVNFKKLHANAIVPVYKSEYSAGADLSACLDESVVIRANQTVVIPTGLAVEIPEGYFGMVNTRSGLAAKHSVIVLNAPGIVDADYRGEVKLIMKNLSEEDFVVEHGMRLAQFIITPFAKAQWHEVAELSETARGSNGLGSSGI